MDPGTVCCGVQWDQDWAVFLITHVDLEWHAYIFFDCFGAFYWFSFRILPQKSKVFLGDSTIVQSDSFKPDSSLDLFQLIL